MKCGRLDSKQLNSPPIVSRSLVYAIILCRYDLFSSLSLLHSFQCLLVYRSCGDCPRNETACLADHCVSADGQRRGILTANRQMPGPTIQVSSIISLFPWIIYKRINPFFLSTNFLPKILLLFTP